jgi:hypothetical protein
MYEEEETLYFVKRCYWPGSSSYFNYLLASSFLSFQCYYFVVIAMHHHLPSI